MRSGWHRPVGRTRRAAGGFAAVLGLFLSATALAEEGLVAHYTFEEGPGDTVKDHSGQGNDGKNMGARHVKLPDGKGYAMCFDTPDAHVDCGDGPSLDLTEALTLELWFNPKSLLTKGEMGVVGKIMGSYCMAYSNRCWFYSPDSGSFTSTEVLTSGWHHIAATFDGKHVRTYRDGRLEGSAEAKASTLPHGGNFYLRYPATYDGPVKPPLVCTMDDVQVYNRALSDAEIAEHYRSSAKASGRHDTAWFDRPKLTLHTFPQSATLAVQADYGQMTAIPAGSWLDICIRNAAGKVVVKDSSPLEIDAADDDNARRAEFSDALMEGVIDRFISVGYLRDGDYVLDVSIRAADDTPIGETSSLDLSLPLAKPDWIRAYDDVKVLNNLVAELLTVNRRAQKADGLYTFKNPRDGWVFISSTASAQGEDTVSLLVDGESVVEHISGKGNTLEAMRRLPAGEHTLRVQSAGEARVTELVVLAIPEIHIAELGATPWMPPLAKCSWSFLERSGLLESANVVVELNDLPENAAGMASWLASGRERYSRLSVGQLWAMKTVTPDQVRSLWTETRGMQRRDYHGVLLDEFSGSGVGGLGKYPAYTEAFARIAGDPAFKGKALYPYCIPMHTSGPGIDMVKAVVDGGYKWAEEKYLTEQPTEEKALEYMLRRYVRNTLRYNETIPGCARHMIMTLGYMSAPPETLNIDPGVDFKTYMDMQMQLLANHSSLFGLYGVQWYLLRYADEEDARFSAKLYRHYCIEGRKDRMTDDPYILPHIVNPDFDEGDAGWTLEPAEPGGVTTGHAKGYGRIQTRCRGGNEEAGDNFLLTRRSAKAPNRFSQTIKSLTPGRTYSVKMFSADYNHLKSGKSEQKTHHVNVKIDDVDMIPAKEFHYLFPSGQAGHGYPPFNTQNNLYETYHRVVFRARGQTAKLTISDWLSDTRPGGQIGRMLMHNFIEVQPYLED